MIISTFERWKEKVVQPPTPTHEELLALDAEVRKHLHFQAWASKGLELNFTPSIFSYPLPFFKVEENQKTKILIQVWKSDPRIKKSFPPPHFFPGRFLNSRPILGFVATSTFPLLASSANHPPSVRQNDCLVSFRDIILKTVKSSHN